MEMSSKDPLKDNLNKKNLFNKINDLIENEQPFSIVILNLENFNAINEALGNEVGSVLIKKISEWFVNNLRKEDIITRYSDDEFCLILYGLDKKGSNEVIQRLYKLFQLQSFYPENIPISFSYGISSFPEDSKKEDKLLSIADNKIYQMKEIKLKE